jgi:RNA polymerase sigma-70 factor (sigma-E family)
MDDRAEAEFSEFVHTRWLRLVRLAYGITGDPGLAEDLTQTALANAYAAWARVRRAEDRDAYVRRILLNAHRGSVRKVRPREQLAGAVHMASGSAPAHPTVPDPSAGYGDRSAIMAALRQLPPKQREIVVLRYWLDLTEHQVAATLGCSVGNVKSQTSRAMAKLRACEDLSGWRAL